MAACPGSVLTEITASGSTLRSSSWAADVFEARSVPLDAPHDRCRRRPRTSSGTATPYACPDQQTPGPRSSGDRRGCLKFARICIFWRIGRRCSIRFTGSRPRRRDGTRLAAPAHHQADRPGGPGTGRAGGGTLVEVYPAASLYRWGLPHRGYKSARHPEALGQVIDQLQAKADWLELGQHENLCRRSHDGTDAVIAALIAPRSHAKLDYHARLPSDASSQDRGLDRHPSRSILEPAPLNAVPAHDVLRVYLREDAAEVAPAAMSAVDARSLQVSSAMMFLVGDRRPVWLDDLKYLVALRNGGGPIPHSLRSDLLHAVIDDFSYPIDDHGGKWNSGAWIRGFSGYPVIAEKLEELAVTLPPWQGGVTNWRWIRRGDVFGGHEPLGLFLATMAWGFGRTGYGRYRTQEIIATAGIHKIAEVVQILRRTNTDSGVKGIWLAFSADGPAKLYGVGTAFASKVAYFACYDRSSGTGPLIADRNTAWASWALEGIWDSRARVDLYSQYVTAATAWSKLLDTRSDNVERAFFELGSHARRIYNEIS